MSFTASDTFSFFKDLSFKFLKARNVYYYINNVSTYLSHVDASIPSNGKVGDKINRQKVTPAIA